MKAEKDALTPLNKLPAELRLGALTLFWGFAVLFARWALDGAAPFVILSLRFGLATVLILPWLEKLTGKRPLKTGLILGSVLFAGFAFQLLGLLYTSVSRNGFLSYTYAAFVPFLQVFITKKRPELASILGLLVVLLGMAFLTGSISGEGGLVTGGMNTGDWLSLAAAVCFALHIVFINHFGDTGAPVRVTMVQSGTVAVLSLLVMLFWPGNFLNLDVKTLGSITWLAIFPTAIAFLGQNAWQHQSTAVRAVLIYSLDPLISFAIGVFAFGDPCGSEQILGAVLILGGIVGGELAVLRRAKD